MKRELKSQTFVKGDLVRDLDGDIVTFETMLSDDLGNINCVVIYNNQYYLEHTSQLTKLPNRLQEIDEEIKKLESERESIINEK